MSGSDHRWYVQSLADGGTHKGVYIPTRSSVRALCGAEFAPLPVGMPPRLGPLSGAPPDVNQICPQCRKLAR